VRDDRCATIARRSPGNHGGGVDALPDAAGVGLGTEDVSRCSVGCDLRLERLL